MGYACALSLPLVRRTVSNIHARVDGALIVAHCSIALWTSAWRSLVAQVIVKFPVELSGFDAGQVSHEQSFLFLLFLLLALRLSLLLFLFRLGNIDFRFLRHLASSHALQDSVKIML